MSKPCHQSPLGRTNRPANASDKPKFLVTTLFGRMLLDADEIMTVFVGDGYTTKLVRQLREGDRVPLPKSMVPRITVDQAGAALSEDERYQDVYPILFGMLDNGVVTTSFRKALTEGRMLVGEEVKKLASLIAAALAAADAGVTEGHIEKGWLGGTVVSPRRRLVVFPALIPIAPRIGDLINPEFEKAYGDYIITRQQIMKLIYKEVREEIAKRHKKGKCKNAEEKEPNQSIRMIVDHLVRKMGDLWGVTVLKIEELGQNSPVAERSRELENAVARTISDSRIGKKTMERMYLESQALLPMVNRIVHEFMRRFFSQFFDPEQCTFGGVGGGVISPASKGREILGAAFGLNADFYRRLALAHYERMKIAGVTDLAKFFPMQNIELVALRSQLEDELLARFKEHLYKGVLDRFYRCREGALEELFRRYYELEGVLLMEYKYSSFLKEIIDAKMKVTGVKQPTAEVEREELRRITKADKRLLKASASTICTPAFMCAADDELGVKVNDLIFARRMSPKQAVGMYNPLMALGIEKGYTAKDETVFALLQSMGMQGVIHIYPGENEFAHTAYSELVGSGMVNVPMEYPHSLGPINS